MPQRESLTLNGQDLMLSELKGLSTVLLRIDTTVQAVHINHVIYSCVQQVHPPQDGMGLGGTGYEPFFVTLFNGMNQP